MYTPLNDDLKFNLDRIIVAIFKQLLSKNKSIACQVAVLSSCYLRFKNKKIVDRNDRIDSSQKLYNVIFNNKCWSWVGDPGHKTKSSIFVSFGKSPNPESDHVTKSYVHHMCQLNGIVSIFLIIYFINHSVFNAQYKLVIIFK